MRKFTETLKQAEHMMLFEMAYGFSNAAEQVTKMQLLDLIKNTTAADTKIKFTSITDATYKKKNPLGTIYKASQVEGLINVDYAARKQAELSAKLPGSVYTPGKSYGVHASPAVIEHNTKWYIQTVPEKTEKPIFVVRSTIGQFAIKDKATVSPYLAPVQPTPATPEIVLRRYSIESLVAVELNGKSYEVSDVEQNRKEALTCVNQSASLASTPSKLPDVDPLTGEIKEPAK